MLDSDIGNTILPHVRFYQKEVKHEFNSEKEGRPIYFMADFVRIEIPGNQYSIIDTFANKSHQDKYPIQWAKFQNEKRELGDDDITGTLLKDWSILTAAQVRELKHYHFYTVEQVAQASDDQISKIQMIIGMGAHVFRQKAKDYLSRAKDSSILNAQADELRKRDVEIEQLKEQMNRLLEQASLEPKKRGRPRAEDVKIEEEANNG
jgi:hypothetical protein